MKNRNEPLPPGCAVCCGAPHIIGSSGGAMRCTCARGQALAHLERERRKRRVKKRVVTVHDGKAAAGGE